MEFSGFAEPVRLGTICLTGILLTKPATVIFINGVKMEFGIKYSTEWQRICEIAVKLTLWNAL